MSCFFLCLCVCVFSGSLGNTEGEFDNEHTDDPSGRAWFPGEVSMLAVGVELEKAEAEEQAELEKQRAIMEFDPAHLD